MMACNYLISLYLFLLFSCIVFAHSKEQKVPALYVFGDSLLDVGNNNYLPFSLVKANFLPNGIDFPLGKSTGRFCNGKNAADFIADRMGLPTPPPYLSLAKYPNNTNILVRGVNFASGGAGFLDGSDAFLEQSCTLRIQLQQYTIMHTQLLQKMGTIKAQKYFSKSLYLIAMGSTDIFGYFRSSSSPYLPDSPQKLINSMIISIKGYFETMYNLGARKFIVFGIGMVGCCPSLRAENETGECKEAANYWSDKFNQKIKSLLQEMQVEHKDLQHTFLDTYGILVDFIQRPAYYGFNEVKAACCGLGYLNAKVPCIPIAEYCSQRRDHVFWDLYHPTEESHKLFVDAIFDGSQGYVHPINASNLISQ